MELRSDGKKNPGSRGKSTAGGFFFGEGGKKRGETGFSKWTTGNYTHNKSFDMYLLSPP